ncbi:hypothetical protein MKW98_023810, partial [Papaver atlanticum]
RVLSFWPSDQTIIVGVVFLYWMDSQGKESLHDHNETSEQSGEQLDSEGENEIQEEEILDLELQTGVDNPLPSAVQSQNAKVFSGEAPAVGMVFDSENQAYDYYNAYGRFLGFSIRKSKMVIRKDKTVTRRVFCCSKEGFRCKHPRGDPMRPRPVTRTGCKARLGIQLQDDGKYSINEFVEEHNHVLAPPSEAHMLRSQRKSQDPQTGSIESILSLIREEAGESPNANQGDCSNYVQRWCYETLKRAEEDKKRIRELSAELHRERRQCAAYREKMLNLGGVKGNPNQHNLGNFE